MKTDTLIDAIGKIDAVYVEEAQLWQKQRTSRVIKFSFHGRTRRILATAACLLLVTAGVFAALRSAYFSDKSDGAAVKNESSEWNDSADQETQNTEEESAPGEAGSDNGSANEGDNSSGSPGEMDGTGEELPETENDAEVEEIAKSGLEIPEEVSFVTVTHGEGGTEERFALGGEKLESLKEWANNLTLGEAVTFEEGAYPGDNFEAGEYFFFDFGEAYPAFSYRDFGDCYIVMEDVWYPVLNPTEPPV